MEYAGVNKSALPVLTDPRSVHDEPVAEYCHLPVAATVEPVTAMPMTGLASRSWMPVWVLSALA